MYKKQADLIRKFEKTSKEKFVVAETWLPCFPGFYESWLSVNDESVNEDLKEYFQGDELENIQEHFYNTEEYSRAVSEYEKNVCEEFTELIECELIENFVSKIIFETMRSPKEYNFTTDSLNVQVYFSKTNIRNIKTFLKENFAEWEKYLKKTYKSYDGFMSFYDYTTDSEDWKDIDECLTDKHKAGSILQFICNQLFDDETIIMSTLEDVYFSVDYEALKNEVQEKWPIDLESMTEQEREFTKKVINERALDQCPECLKLF
jgi:antibiotic biosynthesis monooxygenase (ABM) superfamily enzyme